MVKSIKQLKKELDRVFSLYIRLRDSDSNGFGRCITCGRVRHYKKADCGHYMKRQYLATRYDEKNCNLQCKHCNAFLQGANEIYKVKIDEKYGPGTSGILEIKSRNPSKFDRFIYGVLIREYREKLKEFKNVA